MGGLYYNLALRNSDVGNKDSEKLYYMCLEEQGYGGSGNIRQLSEPDFRGSRRLMPGGRF